MAEPTIGDWTRCTSSHGGEVHGPHLCEDTGVKMTRRFAVELYATPAQLDAAIDTIERLLMDHNPRVFIARKEQP